MNVLLRQDKTYRAVVSLSWLESLADNDQVANRFIELGFRDVSVTGSGAERVAQGTWIGGDRDFDLKGHPITDVEEVEDDANPEAG